ncbi:5607_t:CDS:2 [Ambispora gerdemannii]|uniref:5607_t:CDS:1 n=1 Tax=Ambispora gerdemannii TaxID=144530 RepID=A0A9N9EW32_9GLOM|nr:5607_t:CDS:2 [Ambispora gerdemannii]
MRIICVLCWKLNIFTSLKSRCIEDYNKCRDKHVFIKLSKKFFGRTVFTSLFSQNEKKSPQIINFWSLELANSNYETVISVEQKRHDDEPDISSPSLLGKRAFGDEPVEIDEISVDYTKHPLLKKYCTLLSKLQHHRIEESQRARHIINMLKWHIVDQEMFNDVGWTKIPQRLFVSKPSFCLRLVSNVLKQHSNDQLHLAERALQKLKLDDKYFDIDALTVVGVVSSIILKKFVPVWELHHLISGNGGRGSARSDFAAIVTNHNDLQFPFFTIEFERGGFEIHKDNIVVVSEAVYELNRILALAHNLSEEEVNRTRIHIGLVNDTRISFNTITPVFNQEESTFVYVNNDKVLSYNLKTDDIEKNIENVLQLVIYLRETICEDGLWIETILNREPTTYNYKLKALLPQLPNEALGKLFTAEPLIPNQHGYNRDGYLAEITNSIDQVQQLLDLLILTEQAFSPKLIRYLSESYMHHLTIVLHNDLKETDCDSLIIVHYQSGDSSKFSNLEQYGIVKLEYKSVEQFHHQQLLKQNSEKFEVFEEAQDSTTEIQAWFRRIHDSPQAKKSAIKIQVCSPTTRIAST